MVNLRKAAPNLPLTALAGRRGLFIGMGAEPCAAGRYARRMATLGARLAVSCAAPGPVHAGQRPGVPLMPCDLRDPLQVRAVVEQAATLLGGFDFVVHSIPRVMAVGPADDPTPESSDEGLRSMRLYCMSFAETARLCVPHMEHGGAVVSLQAGAGLHGAEPCALTALRDSILRYLALELEPWSVRVLCLEAGAMAAGSPGGPRHAQPPASAVGRQGGNRLAPLPERIASAASA